MPIKMEVDVQGIDSWKLRLSNPEAVREPMRRFLRRSANVARPAVMANIPVYSGTRVLRTRQGAVIPPGTGRRSVKIKMTAGRYQVRVFSRLFYIRFLEHGTQTGRRALARSRAQFAQFHRNVERLRRYTSERETLNKGTKRRALIQERIGRLYESIQTQRPTLLNAPTGPTQRILPRLMFARAAETIQGQVQGFAREMVREILAKVKG